MSFTVFIIHAFMASTD